MHLWLFMLESARFVTQMQEIFSNISSGEASEGTELPLSHV